jgi:hypothetical protein
MEINDRIVAWLFLNVFLAYPIFAIWIVAKSFWEKDKRNVFILQFETAIKRFVISIIGFLLLMFIAEIINDYTDYKILTLMPELFKQVYYHL